MTTVRQDDGDNAIVRWRECDDTMATERYDYRIVAIVLSHCHHRIVALELATGQSEKETDGLPVSWKER
ncbi:hypothetical protein DPMN_083963 [Dreissena polymorpha]|uniref:Uncharacterized protein n=1 Tax=Dreissena polymorpha TaxID=45954 RepID=A0A9D3Y9Y0_DREPO|nr:hypothetical protein DPMN_083963 [Dreissena polymorpha]